VERNKICPRCKNKKFLSKFSKSNCTKDGLQSACKECKGKEREERKNIQKEYMKIYQFQNKKKLKNYLEEYYEKNKEKHNLRVKKWKLNNPDIVKKSVKKWFKNNPEYLKNYMNGKYKTDINFKIQNNLRNKLNRLLKIQNVSKSQSSLKMIGCSIQEYINHLELKFKPEMNWVNHGKIWEIDHIIPCSKFDLNKLEEQQKCFHYSNTQPLFKTTQIAEEIGYNEMGNRNKSNKI
jgi:hypothetical protein